MWRRQCMSAYVRQRKIQLITFECCWGVKAKTRAKATPSCAWAALSSSYWLDFQLKPFPKACLCIVTDSLGLPVTVFTHRRSPVWASESAVAFLALWNKISILIYYIYIVCWVHMKWTMSAPQLSDWYLCRKMWPIAPVTQVCCSVLNTLKSVGLLKNSAEVL